MDRLWPRPLRERYSRNMQRLFDDGQGLRFTREARGLRRDGSEFPGEMTWGVVEIASGPLMLDVGRDISARLEADQRVRRYSAERAVVASLGERALAGVDPAELAGQVAEAVAKTMEVGMVQVLELVRWRRGPSLMTAGASEDQPGRWRRRARRTRRRRSPHPGRWPSGWATSEGAPRTPTSPARTCARDGGGGATGEEVFGVIAAYPGATTRSMAGRGVPAAVANVLATLSVGVAGPAPAPSGPSRPADGTRQPHALQRPPGQAVARSRRSGDGIAVLFIDLNDFKAVNDRHGHAAGDEVLVAVARRLADVVRPSDTVGRVGGDEFLVICEDVNEQSAVALGRRLAAVARRPVEAAAAQHQLSASIGIALSTSDPPEPDVLVRTADAAAYRRSARTRTCSSRSRIGP